MYEFLRNIIAKILIILLAIYLVIFIPILWNYHPLIIVSGSMEPILKVGGILYYHPKKVDEFKKNEILVFKSKKHIISHRIVDISNKEFITKGDANKKVDSFKVSSQILGEGTNFSIPLIGYYVDFIYNHKYVLLLVSLSLFIDLFRKEMVIKRE